MTDDGLSDNKLRGFVEGLLCSTDSVDGVSHILAVITGIVGAPNVEWRDIGEVENNASLARTTGPMGSFIEKATNGVDGYSDLYRTAGTTARNVHELVAEAYEGHERVYMVFDGDSPKGPTESDVNVMVADEAVGQSPETFPVFFNALDSGEYKKGLPFFHGCRGIGGMAALGHTKEGYQVIVSASAENPELWTVGITRQNGDGTYQYLTIDGELPTFEGALDLDDPVGEMRHGTAVKLFGYQFERSPQRATNAAFRRRLSAEFENPAIPIHLVDKRASDDEEREHVYRGIEEAATGPYSDVFYDPKRETLHVDGFGEVEVVALGAKPKDKRQEIAEESDSSVSAGELVSLNRFFTSEHRNRVLVSANGRVHAVETGYLLGSRGSLDAVNDEMYVLVRLKEPPASVDEGPFKIGRDGFADKRARNELRDAVFGVVRDSSTIQSWDDAHQSENTPSSSEDDGVVPSITVDEDTHTVNNAGCVTVSVSCSNVLESPVFRVTDDDLQVAGVSFDGETARVTIEATADRVLSGAIVEEETGVVTGDISVRPQWAAVDTDALCSDASLVDVVGDITDDVHRRTLERLGEDAVAPAAARIVEDCGVGSLLSNLPSVVDDSMLLLKQLGVEQGADAPSQWARNKVGRLFEMLVYVAVVDVCQEHGLTAYHEPSVDAFAGLTHHGSREPDTDIVVTVDASDADAPVYVLSLKTSLKDRVAQMAYWSRVFRDARASCRDEGCPVGDGVNAIEAECPVYYKYLTLSRDGAPNDVLLNELDGGFVPEEKVAEGVDGQQSFDALSSAMSAWRKPQPAGGHEPETTDSGVLAGWIRQRAAGVAALFQS